MNKAELFETLATSTELSKQQVEKVIIGFTEVVMDRLKHGEEVTITGFGAFSARRREARKGINPQTKEAIDIPAVIVPKFKAGKVLKEALKN